MNATDSILQTIKKALSLDASYEAFDQELIMFINSAIDTLRQLGFGPDNGYMISSSENTWDEYMGDKALMFQSVKDYIYCSVRLMFDPPANSFGIEAIKKRRDELAWRICAECSSTS